MTTVTATPHTINWSRNQIFFTLHTDTPIATPGLTIEFRIHFCTMAARPAFQQLVTLPLTPDANGNVSIDVRRILNDELTYELPASLTLPNIVGTQSGQFYISFREVTTEQPEASWTVGEDQYTVLKGGLPLEHWKGSSYFTQYSNPMRKWMTWRQSGYSIGSPDTGVHANDFITYLHLEPNMADGIVQYKMYYTDGTTAIHQEPAPGDAYLQYLYYHIPVGHTMQLRDIQPAKTIERFSVQPIAGGAELAPEFFFTMDYKQYYDSDTLYYFTSLGGFECVRVLGDVDPEVNRTTITADVYETYNGGTATPRQRRTQHVQERVVYKGNIGSMEDPMEQEVLRDLLLALEVYQYAPIAWIPVEIITETVSLGAKAQQVFNFPIEWTYAFNNESYAPSNLKLFQ